jgi:hypothetical protein
MPTYGDLILDILTFPIKPIVSSKFRFMTDIIEAGGGGEYRRPAFVEHQNTLTIESLTYPECRKSDLAAFRSFYTTKAKGNLNSFRFKNPLDFKATRAIKQHGTNTSSQCIVVPGVLTGGDWRRRIIKKYNFGNVSGYKTILYPDITTLKVFVDNVQRTDFFFTDAGILVIPGTAELANVEAECEFYRRYRFAPENITIQRPDTSRYVLSPLTMIEDVRINHAPIKASDFKYIDKPFGLGFLPSYTETLRFEAYEKTVKTGRVLAEERFTASKSLFEIDGTVLHSKEKDNLLCMFLAAKGSLLPFAYGTDGIPVRFDTDELEISLEVDGVEC